VQAGTQLFASSSMSTVPDKNWIPACAGMTTRARRQLMR
jgi:hypothetical protein